MDRALNEISEVIVGRDPVMVPNINVVAIRNDPSNTLTTDISAFKDVFPYEGSLFHGSSTSKLPSMVLFL